MKRSSKSSPCLPVHAPSLALFSIFEACLFPKHKGAVTKGGTERGSGHHFTSGTIGFFIDSPPSWVVVVSASGCVYHQVKTPVVLLLLSPLESAWYCDCRERARWGRTDTVGASVQGPRDDLHPSCISGENRLYQRTLPALLLSEVLPPCQYGNLIGVEMDTKSMESEKKTERGVFGVSSHEGRHRMLSRSPVSLVSWCLVPSCCRHPLASFL